jgi:hypothetical protein
MFQKTEVSSEGCVITCMSVVRKNEIEYSFKVRANSLLGLKKTMKTSIVAVNSTDDYF